MFLKYPQFSVLGLQPRRSLQLAQTFLEWVDKIRSRFQAKDLYARQCSLKVAVHARLSRKVHLVLSLSLQARLTH